VSGPEGGGGDGAPGEDDADAPGLPFPDSLCHRCGAPPKYIRTERSVFIRCPILKVYPPQPVERCDAFVAREGPTGDISDR
jgi:hypothetical protein